MGAIRLVTDSASDLPLSLARALDITIVPLLIIFGEESYRDTDLSSEEFWRLADGSLSPTTSQPPMGAFRQAFERLTEKGANVLCVTLTSEHSGTYDSARSAAREFGDRVTVIDSRSLSWGQAWQAIRAAHMVREGNTLREIVEALESLRRRTHFVIALDQVENLRRGGRVAKLMPIIERFMQTLNLKPMLNIVEGEVKLLGVARSRSKSVMRILQEIERHRPLEKLAVMHIRCREEAEGLADALTSISRIPREQIAIQEAGAVLACHGGRGVLAAIALAAE